MKIKYQVIAFLGALALAGTVAAGERAPRPDRGHLGMGAEVIEHLSRALRQLDLSEEQRDAIHQDMQGLRESMKPLVRELVETRKALQQQIISEAYDAEAVADLAERQGNLSAEMTIIASEVAAGVLARLTEEQRAELERMAETRRVHRQAHRDIERHRRGRRGDLDG